MSTKAIFLDRDGVINRKPTKGNYVKSWDEFELLPGVEDAVKLIRYQNCLPIVVTNQRCVAKGIVSVEVIKDIHKKLNSYLDDHGAAIEYFYICPHDYSDDCDCRKPKPGMIHKAITKFNIDPKKSWLIGDSDIDIEAGKRASVNTKKIRTNGSLFAAVKEIFQT